MLAPPAGALLGPAGALARAVVLLAAAASCSRPAGTLAVDRVHDLVARLDLAEFAEGSPYQLLRQAAIDPEDHRDGIAYLRTPPGQPLTFRDLLVAGDAVLRFGCGTTRLPDAPPGDTPLTFRVQIGTHASGAESEPALRTVFEQRIDPATLADEARLLTFEVPLPGAGERRLDLRLSTWFPDDANSAEARAEWPAWFSPQLRSDGRQLPAGELRVGVREIVFDPIERLAGAEVLVEAESDPVQRSMLDPAAGLGMGGGSRPVLRAAAPSQVRYSIDVEHGCQLEWAVGIASWQGWKRGGDGMTFRVDIDGERVWERRLDAHGVSKDRGWHAARLSLDRWAGRRVRLDLLTEPGAGAEFDIGGWSDIAVVRRHEVPARLADAGPSVILVLVDTLRADRIGAFGGTGGLTPQLDALAQNARVFPTARSASSWTWPATTSILTGLYPNSHGVQDDQHCLLVESLDTLPELFARAGYETGAFVANPLIATENNFQQGFATFASTPSLTARALNARLAAWLDNTDGRARFAYLHYMDPHQPYHAPPGFAPPPEDADVVAVLRQALADQLEGGRPPEAADPELLERWVGMARRAYDAEVAYFDTAFGELLELLAAHGVLEDALLVFTSDHGEEFLDHGYWAHGPQLYDETLHVPLFVAGFGRSKLTPGRVSMPVETMDILPTLVEQLGLPAPAYALPGRTLLRPAPGAVFGQTWHGLQAGVDGFTEKQSVATERWKLIRTPAVGRVELYDLQSDPLERHDRAGEEPELRAALLAELETWHRVTSARTPDNLVRENPEAVARLQALGYLGR